jgi:hypothetical protein
MENSKSSKLSETRKDFKISWQLLKSNYKSFIATEIFAILAFIIINAVIFGIIALIFVLSPNLSITDLIPRSSTEITITFRIYFLFAILSYLTMSGFLYCQFGLAYDIFTSGDMFTEFKKSFVYFKEHWWKYILLTFITGFGFFVPDRRIGFEPLGPIREQFQNLFVVFITIRFIILYLLLVIFSSTLPSVTAQRSLKNSFIESIRILKKDFKRLFSTWGLFVIIFNGPAFILSLTLALILPIITGTVWVPILMAIILILYLYNLFLGFPMMSLISTRIYNSVDFERFKPLMESAEKENVRVSKE